MMMLIMMSCDAIFILHRAICVMITRMACGLLFASYIDEVTGKQRRSCAEYVAAAMTKAAELGATEERHRLSLLRQLLSGCLQESKFDRSAASFESIIIFR